jgi:hypothetical protein
MIFDGLRGYERCFARATSSVEGLSLREWSVVDAEVVEDDMDPSLPLGISEKS